MTLLQQDLVRNKALPPFQRYFRLCQSVSRKNPLWFMYKTMYKFWCLVYCIEMPTVTQIGGGLLIGHSFCITINPKAVIGKNVNIHKGLTIGQENRGKRKGVPRIGDKVWIGVNCTIVGNITIGDDVMIAPNTFVNCDVPSHSVVFGNPCIIKHKENATEGYINNII